MLGPGSEEVIWIALVGASLVGLTALKASFGLSATEADIEAEMERLKSRR